MAQTTIEDFALTALSPVDGRYYNRTQSLSPILSEFGLIKYRVVVEIAWFLALSQAPDIAELPKFSAETENKIKAIAEEFDLEDAKRVKTIEKTTNHDLKAVEYFLKEKLKLIPGVEAHLEFIHFACTSEDINNLAYALMLKAARQDSLLPNITALLDQLSSFSQNHYNTPMMSRTHGQPATPTTLGKEFANVCYRIKRQVVQFENTPILGKINGAVGNFNAHLSAYPDVKWAKLSQDFVESLGLTYNPYTTQIEPHDYVAEYLHALIRLNTILIDFSRDIWGYIAFDYLGQQPKAGEVGSSTMPHKVNPIDFENAEGNLGLANALMAHLASKLPISRFQRDLTDSTTIRNLGASMGYLTIALAALQKGMEKVKACHQHMENELDENWALLAEPIQTVMRRYGLENPYEQLKALTRGQEIQQSTIQEFISGLALPEPVKRELLALKPNTYLGLAEELTKTLESHLMAIGDGH